MSKKIAVVLLNLGGPLKTEDIQPFLFNFFMDKNIISLPFPFRYLLAKWISWTRGRGVSKENYALLGGKSPLLENTQKQAKALEEYLLNKDKNIRVFISMRYWHPLSSETVKEVKEYEPEEIILLPLYPQFSTTTSFSSLQDWYKESKKQKLNVPTTDICCYMENKGFIEASRDLIQECLNKEPYKTRLLFSAHGLPEKIIQGGDPYEDHCKKTARAIVEALHDTMLDWQLCYQSRVGRLKWIGPSTEEALQKAADDKIGVLIYPLAFVSEHVETMVEIDIEYRELAKKYGVPSFTKVPTVGISSKFIEGLGNLVLDRTENKICDGNARESCSSNFPKCYRRIKNV